jgi:hypothetical protein
MPLPEKDYFSLEEVEERWGMRRRDTIYYAENGLLEISIRVRGVVLDAGFVEVDEDGRWLKILEDRYRFSGLLALHEHDLTEVFLHGAARVHSFRAEEGRYLDVVQPEDGVNVLMNALVVTRPERDRFEREHGLSGEINNLGAHLEKTIRVVDCSEDGGWIRVGTRQYLFTGLFQKGIVRQLYEAWHEGNPRVRTQSLLEDVGSRSKQISHVFSGADPRWREVILYSKGYVWLNADT